MRHFVSLYIPYLTLPLNIQSCAPFCIIVYPTGTLPLDIQSCVPFCITIYPTLPLNKIQPCAILYHCIGLPYITTHYFYSNLLYYSFATAGLLLGQRRKLCSNIKLILGRTQLIMTTLPALFTQD